MNMDTSAQAPVLIVGGGLSGLSAAALLARAGCAVTLFEKAEAPGGQAVTKRHSGFSFNLGAHALYTKGPAEKLLRELGGDATIGPMLIGMEKPVQIAPMTAIAPDVMTLAVLAAAGVVG